IGKFIDKTIQAIDEKADVADKLFTFIEMHYKQLAETPQLAVVTQLELRQSKQVLRYEINKILKTYLDVIDSIIEQGVKEEKINREINPRLIRQMIFGTIDETVTTWVMNSQRYSLVDQAKEVHQLLMYGLF